VNSNPRQNCEYHVSRLTALKCSYCLVAEHLQSKYEYDCVGGPNCPVRSAVEGGHEEHR
jgi:hypothetical protein